MSERWDLFCRVVDNFGDAGVAWRLARQLAHERAIDVRLAIDDLDTLAAMVPGVDPALAVQRVEGVHVRRWAASSPTYDGAQVIVELFQTGLDESYLHALAEATTRAQNARRVAPVWINLEYLSAEPWVATHHGLPSTHPRLPLTQWFFFPGFDAASGGLMRERGLVEARDAYQTKLAPHDGLDVSLFCYETAPIEPLLAAWAGADERVRCRVPAGRAAEVVGRFFGASRAPAGARFERDALTVEVIAFIDQAGYDRLLWSSDLNFVRGEDSFVRAQWAARPLVWHIYPQAERTHEIKLAAFLDRYQAGLPQGVAAANRDLTHAWNDVPGAPSIAAAWSAWRRERAPLDARARGWAKNLAGSTDLVTRLRKFVESKRK